MRTGMNRFGLHMGIVVAVTTISSQAAHAQGGLSVKLTPLSAPPYMPNQSVGVNVSLVNQAGTTLQIFGFQLDFTDTEPGLTLPPVFNFIGLPPGSTNNTMPVVHWQVSAGGIFLAPNDERLVGTFPVGLPATSGTYTLDALNDDAPNPQYQGLGAIATVFLPGTGILTWTAQAGQVVGGVHDFVLACEPEKCNGVDDDCDGEVDEGFGAAGVDAAGNVILVPPGSFCLVGQGECERPGSVICSPGGESAECVASFDIPPEQEGPVDDPSCFNWEDDDCDGLSDHEDPDCTSDERCDGFDNDNDGLADEDWPELGDACMVGEGICEKSGTMICTADGQSTKCSANPSPGLPEGPPGKARCNDGLDNDCDGLIDIDDPDCQEPEKCDGLDNDGDGEVDEDFPGLGQLCGVGQGECSAFGIIICDAAGTGTMCGASPGAGDPEGPAGCACADGIDNDCDGLIDIDDPDCGSARLRARAALPVTCGPHDDDCKSWHTIEFDVIDGAPDPTVVAELLALDANNDVIASIPVQPGDQVRLSSRLLAVDFVATTTQFAYTLSSFAAWDDCQTGPDNGPLAAGCAALDTDCDDDLDLADYALWQQQFGQTVTYHEVAAPTPILHVQANDGHNRARAVASNIPFLAVVEPDDTVVSISEGDVTRVEVAIPRIDPASLFVKVDGVDLFAGLGLDPATDFPGGPFGGEVMIGDCLARVCDLVVDSGPIGSLSANMMTMYIENLCCGGHVIVVEGEKQPGSYPDNPDPNCNVDDLRDKGFSQGFEVVVDFPTQGQITPGGPTPVSGSVCHGRELFCPFPTICPPQVKLNGLYVPLAGPIFTPGDGEDSADTYRYTFSAVLQPTNLFQEVIGGAGVHGTLDPGGNRLIAEAQDDDLNTTFSNTFFVVGPMQIAPGPLEGNPSVDKAVTLALDAPALVDLVQTAITSGGNDLLGLMNQELEQWANEMQGFQFEIDTPYCDPVITVYPDISSLPDPIFDPNAVNYVITPGNGQVTVHIDLPPTSFKATAGGKCKITGCSIVFPNLCICLLDLKAQILAEFNLDGAAIEFIVTEDAILNNEPIDVALLIDPSDVFIDVLDDDMHAKCVYGPLVNLLNLIVQAIPFLDNKLEAVIENYINNGFDITEFLQNVDIEPIRINLFELAPATFPEFMMKLAFEKSQVEITPTGLAVGFTTTFTPTMVDGEIDGDLPGTPLTDAPLPQPFIPFADGLTVAFSDDAFNQMLYGLTVTGKFKTEFEDVRVLGDLLPANCGTLQPAEQGQCVALKGGNCAALPPGDAQDACLETEALSAFLNIDADTPILLHGRMDVPPKLLLADSLATPNIVEGALRLSQLSVAILADRDGDGMHDGPYSTVPSCFGWNPATLEACSMWEACLDIDFPVHLLLNDVGGGVIEIETIVTGSSLSTGVMCSGGTMGPSAGPFDDIAQGLVVDLLEDMVSDNTPPLRFEGLDFGGLFSFQNPHLIQIKNGVDPNFGDYLGITGDIAP